MKTCDKHGKVSNDTLVFNYADKANICEECILQMHGIVDKKYTAEYLPVLEKESNGDIPSVDTIISHLNKTIVGQVQAKETLAIAVRNHYKRLSLPESERKSVDKSNIMLMGSSGTGKTVLAKALANLIDVPLVVVDASSYTTAGYVGADVDDIIADLYAKSGNDKKATERGIVFLDEIDKKKKSKDSGGRVEPGGEQAQQAFLKLVEGKEVKVNNKTTIDTSNILFIAGGAFVGLLDVIRMRQKENSMGFGADDTITNLEIAYQSTTTDDLINFGMIPEFIGRFPVITYTKDLTCDEIVSIIRDTDNSILKQYKTLFKIEDNIDLEVTDPAILAISQMVLRDKIGVRGIRKVFEQVLHPVQRNAEKIKSAGGTVVKIDVGAINGTKQPEVRTADGKKLRASKYT